MFIPANPKLYHIVHMDRLASIIATGGLLSDAQIAAQAAAGSMIGMGHIKQRRLEEITLTSYPDLHVGHVRTILFLPALYYVVYYLSGEQP